MDEKARGNIMLVTGDLDGALAVFTAGIERVTSPPSPTCSSGVPVVGEEDRAALPLIYANRAKIFADKGDHAAAAEDASAAIALDPSFGKAFARRAAALVSLGRPVEALIDLEKAADLDAVLKESGLFQRQVAEAEDAFEALPREQRHERIITKKTVGIERARYFASSEDGDRYLYPGAPTWWLDNAQRFWELMKNEQVPEKPLTSGGKPVPESYIVDKAKRMKGFRNLMESTRCLANMYKKGQKDGTGEDDTPMSAAEHVRRFKVCGMTLTPKENIGDHSFNELSDMKEEYGECEEECLPIEDYEGNNISPHQECSGCGATLAMEDPAECICGAPFCSDRCHEKHWKRHKPHCAHFCQEVHGGFVQLTTVYWHLVSLGAIPHPLVTDYIDMYRTECQSNPSLKSPEAEVGFYQAEELGEVQRQLMLGENSVQDRVKAVYMAYYYDYRFSKILSTDSFARVVFKYNTCQRMYGFQCAIDEGKGVGIDWVIKKTMNSSLKKQFDKTLHAMAKKMGREPRLIPRLYISKRVPRPKLVDGDGVTTDWVPNEHLIMQDFQQRSMEAVYVFRRRSPDEKKLIEVPLEFPHRRGTSSSSGSGAEDELRRHFKNALETGDAASVRRIYQLIVTGGATLPAHKGSFYSPTPESIADQLKLEFPHVADIATRPAATGGEASSSSSAKRCIVEEMD